MLQGVAENFSSQEVEGMPGEAEIFYTPTHLLPFSPTAPLPALCQMPVG